MLRLCIEFTEVIETTTVDDSISKDYRSAEALQNTASFVIGLHNN